MRPLLPFATLLGTVFLLGCKEQASSPLGLDGLGPQFAAKKCVLDSTLPGCSGGDEEGGMGGVPADGGSVPNRLDDLQGELANVQQLRPEIVTGYVILFDVAKDSVRKTDGQLWSDYFEEALRSISIRRAPLWNQGLLEALWFIRFDSRQPEGGRLIQPREVPAEGAKFARSLLCELRLREPAIPFSRELDCGRAGRA